MVFSKQRSKFKFTGFLFLALTVTLLAALVVGCAPAAKETTPATPEAAPLIIGVVASLNTPMKDAVIAAELAAEEIMKKDGGVTVDGVKRPLKIVSVDDRDLEPGVPVQDSILAYRSLLGQKPAGIVAPIIRTEAQLAIMENIASEKVIQIACGGVNSTWRKNFMADPAKYKYQFKISPTEVDMIYTWMQTLATVKAKFGLNKVYLFGEDVDFARAGVLGAEAVLKKAGFEVPGKDFIPLGTTDYSTAVKKFKDSGAEIGLYIFSSEGAALPKQYVAQGCDQFMMGSCSAFFAQKAWEQTQGAVNGFTLIINGAGNAPVGSKLPKASAFFNNFTAKAGRDVGSVLGISETYDGVYLLANAWNALGTTDPDKVVAYLETNGMDGAIGHITFTAADHQCPYGDDYAKTALQPMIQWQDGKRVTIWPTSIADAEIMYLKQKK